VRARYRVIRNALFGPSNIPEEQRIAELLQGAKLGK
jgi:hypothetical protein